MQNAMKCNIPEHIFIKYSFIIHCRNSKKIYFYLKTINIFLKIKKSKYSLFTIKI